MPKIISLNDRKALLYANVIQKFEFVRFKCPFPMKTKEKVYRPVIVLKDKETGLVVWITDYADYITYYPKLERLVQSNNDRYVKYVARFLTWLFIENYEKYKITDVKDVTTDIIQTFLDQYSSTLLDSGDYPSADSVYGYRAAVSIFVDSYSEQHEGECQVKPGELVYKVVEMMEAKRYKRNVYTIPVKIWNRDRGHKQLDRDMPFEAVPYFLKAAQRFDPELYLAFVLGICAGLREGEVCNMYQHISGIRSGSILRTMRSGECIGIELDLSEDMILRSDNVDIGSIKKKRNRPVAHEFVSIINEAYENHLKLIARKQYEELYAPLFLNKNKDEETGKYKAMTTDSYNKRLQELLKKHVIPAMLNSTDAKVVLFAESLKRHTFGAHAFRHLFTVYLVLSRRDASTIMELRGDSNINSAKDYLRKKGTLDAQYHESAELLGKLLGEFI